MDNDSFLDVENINEENKERLLKIREALRASVAENAKKETRKGMYLISLVIYQEFERLTQHITDPDIIKS